LRGEGGDGLEEICDVLVLRALDLGKHRTEQTFVRCQRATSKRAGGWVNEEAGSESGLHGEVIDSEHRREWCALKTAHDQIELAEHLFHLG
jgi:hypothetical protein